MANNDIISRLKRYAACNVHKLAQTDELLMPVDELVQQYIADQADTSQPISDAEARGLIIWGTNQIDGKPFDNQSVQHYHEIGKKLLKVATNPKSNNPHLVLAAKCLHPLFSQDHRTFDMGFDLEEYMDWYFKDTPQVERQRLAKELIAGWQFNHD